MCARYVVSKWRKYKDKRIVEEIELGEYYFLGSRYIILAQSDANPQKFRRGGKD